MGKREQFLSAPDVKLEKYHVEDRNLDVWLKSWSGLERAKAINYLKKQDDFTAAKILVLSVVDEDGANLFTDKDLAELGKKNGETLEKLAHQCLKFNGIGKGDDEKKESEKTTNSEPVCASQVTGE